MDVYDENADVELIPLEDNEEDLLVWDDEDDWDIYPCGCCKCCGCTCDDDWWEEDELSQDLQE